MRSYLNKIFLIEGIIMGILGVLFFINPVESLFGFTTICGLLIIISAIFRIIRGFYSDSRFYYIFTGILDGIFGLFIFYCPLNTIESLVLLYGVFAFIKGLFSLVVIIKNESFGVNFQSILCVVAIFLGGAITLCPVVILSILPFIPYIIGTYFIFIGVTEVYVGFKM